MVRPIFNKSIIVIKRKWGDKSCTELSHGWISFSIFDRCSKIYMDFQYSRKYQWFREKRFVESLSCLWSTLTALRKFVSLLKYFAWTPGNSSVAFNKTYRMIEGGQTVNRLLNIHEMRTIHAQNMTINFYHNMMNLYLSWLYRKNGTILIKIQ